MKIVLVRPSDLRGDVSILSHATPINLGYLAAYLIKNGYEVEIWDYETQQFFEQDFIQKIYKLQPKIIGFNCFTPTVKSGHKLAKIAKDNFPSIVTLAGGPHPSALPKRTLEEFPNFDLVVVGEGELTLLEVCRAVQNHKGWQGIKGVAYRTDSGVKQEERRPLIGNLDDLPFPRRDLMNLEFYRNGHISRGISNRLKNTEIYTSRGCPIGCFFCAIRTTMGLRLRMRSVENVLAEAEECLKKYNFDHLAIADDSFTYNQERTVKICEGFQKLGVKSWHCEGTRVDIVSPQLLKLMAKSGCKKVVFGVESGSPRILELIGKRITIEQVKNAFKWAREAGIRYIEGDYIIGSHPSETIEDLQKSLDLIKETKPDLISVTTIVPYPGTPAYDFMKEKGYIFSDDWDQYVMLDQLPLWRTEFFTPEDLLKLQRKMLKAFYLRPSYLLHMIGKLRNFEEMKYWSETGFDFIKWLLRGKLT